LLIFLSWFWPLLSWASFLEAAGAVLKIGSSLKPNHHNLLNALLDALLFVQTEFSVQVLRKTFNWTETCFTVLKCSQTQWAVRHESTTIQLLISQLMLKSLKQFSEITSSIFFREKNEVFAINDVTVSVLLFPRKRLLFTRCVCCHFLTLLRSRTPFRWGDWRAILY